MTTNDVLGRSDERSGTDRLAEVLGLDLLESPPEARFLRLTQLTAQIFDVPTAAVTLIADDLAFTRPSAGAVEQAIPRHLTFCSHTVEHEAVLVVPDTRADPRFASHPLVGGREGIRFYAGYPLHGPDGVALGALCVIDTRPREFGDRQRQTLQSLAGLVEREINYQDERDRAEAVQRSLLPMTAPRFPGYQAAGVCLTAHRVGGDFFDWYLSGYRDRLVTTVADVMGKGMPAAILAATVRAVLRAETLRAGMDGSVARTSEDLAADLDATGAFVTLFHAAFGADGEVEFSDAGHGLAVIVRADPAAELDPLRPREVPLGVGPVDGEAVWATHRARLEPGDTLVAFSDGLLELASSIPEAIALAARLARGDLAGLAGRVRQAAGGRGRLADDITVLAVRRDPHHRGSVSASSTG